MNLLPPEPNMMPQREGGLQGRAGRHHAGRAGRGGRQACTSDASCSSAAASGIRLHDHGLDASVSAVLTTGACCTMPARWRAPKVRPQLRDTTFPQAPAPLRLPDTAGYRPGMDTGCRPGWPYMREQRRVSSFCSMLMRHEPLFTRSSCTRITHLQATGDDDLMPVT
jgi:hypothetical protein